VIVVKREDGSSDQYLVAYYTGVKEISSGELRARVSRSLPGFMVPSYYVWQRSFALTPNGKIDRQSLPDPVLEGLTTGGEYVAAVTPTEKQLVEIWKEVLRRDPIGIRDNFFELGGQSLKAIQMLGMIHRETKVQLALRTIFTEPTIEQLALQIQNTLELRALMKEDEIGSKKITIDI